MPTPKDTLCEQLNNEGLALIGTSALLSAGTIRTRDALDVILASIEALTYWKDAILAQSKLQKK